MTAVDVISGQVRGRVHVGREPEGVTLRPDGKVVFVTSELDSEVAAVDVKTLTVVGHMPTAGRPRNVVFAKDGRTAFAMDETGGKVTVLDAVPTRRSRTSPSTKTHRCRAARGRWAECCRPTERRST